MEKQARIRVKSLAWIEDGQELFVVRMHDRVKGDDYYRPIGGSVEFGESAEEAVQREALEELHTRVEIIGAPVVVENRFDCDGEPGHEIDFLVPCRFVDQEFDLRQEHDLVEANGECFKAFWIPIEDCLNGRLRLVPDALLNWYQRNSKSTS